MDQQGRTRQFGTWLRRVWNAAIRTAEAMERTPIDELFDRIDRLEREMAAFKEEARRMASSIQPQAVAMHLVGAYEISKQRPLPAGDGPCTYRRVGRHVCSNRIGQPVRAVHGDRKRRTRKSARDPALVHQTK